MDARKHLIIIKGKDQTDSVASFQFHDGKCEVVYTSAPNKTYGFQSSNVEILPLQKKIDPAQVIVIANGQAISGIDEILDFGGYYRIVRNGKRDLSFYRSEVQFQQNCLADGKNQEAFQYFKETAAAISLVAENGINILSMQYDKIQQVSEDTVLASYLAPQKDIKMPQMPETVIYPFGLNQSQKLAVERALSSKISIIQGPPGTGKTQTILNIIANVVRSGKTVAVVSNNNSATHNVVEKLEKKNAAFLTAFLGSLANKEKFLDAQTGAYPNMSDWEMPPEDRQQLDQETTALSKELNEMLIYDYLIVDEASQVDLATGVLAFSCARNIVIVGDLKQLPNVLTEDDIRTSDAIWQKYSLDERYRFSTHSLLSSALEIWQDAPATLLREHYRCHPKIINFCNQKFYHGQLIVMTKDHDEPDVLTMYRTTAGNHARGHLNQRQIDVIQQEVLPRLHQQNFQSIGIITPYRDQVTAIRKQLGDTYEVDTVHKFQGREQDAIILTSVDNVITDFVDDPHMLNVAVSRAVHSLAVITSQDPRNDQTNYGDLARYIEYNNFEIIQSQIYSVFDMLYQGYAEQRREYLQKHKRVSEYDSENLMHSVIQEILSDEPFSSIGCAVHFSLATLVKDYAPLTEEERKYARNPLTHVDFLLFNQMDKQPVLAIEVDGGSHKSGSKQAERDAKKNSILDKCAIPLLRLRTDGSGEKEKIKNALKRD